MAYEEQLFQKDSEAHYSIHGKETIGIVRGVTTDGFLLVEINGAIGPFDLKEITYVH